MQPLQQVSSWWIGCSFSGGSKVYICLVSLIYFEIFAWLPIVFSFPFFSWISSFAIYFIGFLTLASPFINKITIMHVSRKAGFSSSLTSEIISNILSFSIENSFFLKNYKFITPFSNIEIYFSSVIITKTLSMAYFERVGSFSREDTLEAMFYMIYFSSIIMTVETKVKIFLIIW